MCSFSFVVLPESLELIANLEQIGCKSFLTILGESICFGLYVPLLMQHQHFRHIMIVAIFQILLIIHPVMAIPVMHPNTTAAY